RYRRRGARGPERSPPPAISTGRRRAARVRRNRPDRAGPCEDFRRLTEGGAWRHLVPYRRRAIRLESKRPGETGAFCTTRTVSRAQPFFGAAFFAAGLALAFAAAGFAVVL